MNVTTSDDSIGILANHPWSTQFTVIGYKDGACSFIPKDFFRNWLDEEALAGSFQIGRCSGLGVGSIVKYDQGLQKLVIGKNVSGGLRLRFLLNGQHEIRTISTTMFSVYGTGIENVPMPQYDDTVIHNDVWIGDEALFLGGSVIESGCVIGARSVVPPNFRSEPYGIYVGSPARLVRFRFSEKVREKLLQLAWWDMPLDWVKKNNQAFLVDLTTDEGRALDVIAELQQAKDNAIQDIKIHAGNGVDALNHNRQADDARQREHGLDGVAPAAEAASVGSLTGDQAEALADEFIATLTTLSDLGQHQEVEALARQMTTLLPAHGYGWKTLASVLLLQGHTEQVLAPLQKAFELLPDDATVANDPHARATRPDPAREKGTIVDPLPAAALPTRTEANRAVTLLNSGRAADAALAGRRLTERYPSHALGWKVLGGALCVQGKFDDALGHLRRARELYPADPESLQTLADLLRQQGRAAEAELESRRLIEMKPDLAEGYCILSLSLSLQGRYAEAETALRRALELAPGSSQVLASLGFVQLQRGRLSEAETTLRRALSVDPDSLTTHSNLLFCMTHNENVEAEALVAQHRYFGEHFEGKLRAHWKRHSNSRDPERRLQVGFVSGDLCSHAVASFLSPLLPHLARDPGLMLHAYYNHGVDDNVSRALRPHFATWTPVFGMNDAELADKIRADGVDILIDLSGHTARNRLLSFARKPAPVQASWIGYPGTTGLSAMDYYIADRMLVPPGELDNQFVEKVAYLPANAPFVPSKLAPQINALPALDKGHITFGSFNRLNKLRPDVIRLWAQLLREVPTAQMLLGATPGDGTDSHLIDWFAQEGIGRDRLEFRPQSEMSVYLQQHHGVDICLDTFPYAGGTTTLHAAWMGVPTLTLPGRTAPSRVGGLLMAQLELQSFIASDKADFVKKGVYWANNLSALAELRAGMRERCTHSAVFRPEVIANALSRALRIMWRRWCEEMPPASLDATQEAA